MAADMSKGKSPFYPGQPVPVELFVGRAKQIDRIMNRAVAQVSAGKPIAVFVQGEYGIGKSSIAGFVQWIAEKHQALHGIAQFPMWRSQSLKRRYAPGPSIRSAQRRFATGSLNT